MVKRSKLNLCNILKLMIYIDVSRCGTAVSLWPEPVHHRHQSRADPRFRQGMVMSQVDGNGFKFAVGALTILAVVGNSWLRKRGRAMKVETER